MQMVVRTVVFAILILWMVACSGRQPAPEGAPVLAETLKQRGRALTTQLAASLQQRVAAARAEGGVPAAVEVCRLEAAAIHAAFAGANAATVKRTALRLRNPQNAPDSLEQVWLAHFAAQRAAGGALRDTVVQVAHGWRYFRPIVLLEGCTPCHGRQGADIRAEDLAAIRVAYPSDKAVDFTVGDVRGMFSVSFK